MRKFLGTSIILAGFWAITPLSAAQQAIDLKAALVTAEQSNLELRAARQQRALALAGIATARQFPNPTIGFTAARDTPHEGVSLDLPIEIGGQRGKRIAVAKEEQKAIEIDLGALSGQIRRRTREAFYNALAARQETAQAKSALELATRLRDIAQQRFDAGDVAQLEVLQADVELARAQADHELAFQTQRSADIGLAVLLNRRIEDSIELSGKLETIPNAPTLDAVTADAMRSSSDLVKSAQDLTTEERRLALVKAERIPNLGLSGGADFNSPPDFRAGGKGGIAVTVPLFYHGQGEVALSNARLELLRLTLASQRANVAALVTSSYFDYGAKAFQAKQYRESIVPRTLQMERMAEDSYQAGKTTILTVVDAQRKLNEVQKSYIDALLAAQSAFAVLEETVGVPLD